MLNGSLASIERAIAELTRAARQRREFPGSFLAGTYADFAIHHLRTAARAAPPPHRMRLARIAARLRTLMRQTGRAPPATAFTLAAHRVRGIVADAMQERDAA